MCLGRGRGSKSGGSNHHEQWNVEETKEYCAGNWSPKVKRDMIKDLEYHLEYQRKGKFVKARSASKANEENESKRLSSLDVVREVQGKHE